MEIFEVTAIYYIFPHIGTHWIENLLVFSMIKVSVLISQD